MIIVGQIGNDFPLVKAPEQQKKPEHGEGFAEILEAETKKLEAADQSNTSNPTKAE